LDSNVLAYSSVSGFWEIYNEPESLKRNEFLDQLTRCQLFNKEVTYGDFLLS